MTLKYPDKALNTPRNLWTLASRRSFLSRYSSPVGSPPSSPSIPPSLPPYYTLLVLPTHSLPSGSPPSFSSLCLVHFPPLPVRSPIPLLFISPSLLLSPPFNFPPAYLFLPMVSYLLRSSCTTHFYRIIRAYLQMDPEFSPSHQLLLPSSPFSFLPSHYIRL